MQRPPRAQARYHKVANQAQAVVHVRQNRLLICVDMREGARDCTYPPEHPPPSTQTSPMRPLAFLPCSVVSRYVAIISGLSSSIASTRSIPLSKPLPMCACPWKALAVSHFIRSKMAIMSLTYSASLAEGFLARGAGAAAPAPPAPAAPAPPAAALPRRALTARAPTSLTNSSKTQLMA